MDNSYTQYAEIGVLSIVIQEPSLVSKAKEFIKPDMFTSSPNKIIFRVIETLSNSGSVTDFGTIMSYLQATNSLTSCGGENYLKYLQSQTYNPANLDELCKYILDAYKARELISLASNLPSMVNGGNVDTVISYIRDFTDNLFTQGVADYVSSLNSATNETIENLILKVGRDVKISCTTGLKDLDNVTGGYMPGDFWVIAGRPGMGKSAYMCNSVLHGVPSLIFSREMSKESLVHRLLSISGGVPVFNLRIGALTQTQLETVKATADAIKNLPIYIDTAFNSSVEYIISTIMRYKTLYDVKVVHIDYLQLLSEREENATHEIGRITRNLKLLSNSLGITTVVYSQLNRLVESRIDKRPILSDLRQSGNIEEDVDIGMFLYRDVVYNLDTKHKSDLELLIRKQRNGPPGTLIAQFDDITNRIRSKNG